MTWKVLNYLPITYKLVIASILLFVPFAVLTGLFSHSLLHSTLKTQISNELKNSTYSILNMVKVSVHLSIRNSLRNTAEKNADIVRMFHQNYTSGNLTEKEAKARASQVLLSQTIAQTGFIYSLDSSGTIVVHPDSRLVGQNLAGVAYIDEQIKLKQGYSEYAWATPKGLHGRPKATWMTYFEPWDWIISASAYHDEFDQVINIDDFRTSIEVLKYMESGFSYVLDTAGNIIIHPRYEGRNVYAQGVEIPEGLFNEMLTQRKGEIQYEWFNPVTATTHNKIVVFDTIPGVNWIVVSSADLDDIYKPLKTVQDIGILVGIFCLLGGILIAIQISSSIARQVKTLIDSFARGASGDYSARMTYRGKDEIGQLSAYFNLFMERLKTETDERKKLERQVIEADDKERLSIGQDLHDDLAPHLIGIEVMCQVLANQLSKNSSPAAAQAETIRSLVAAATLKTRALARGLCPIHRVDEGLGFALQELISTVTTFYPVKCQLFGENRVTIKGAIAVHIYRIIQEALYNAVKHANPTLVTVTLTPGEEFFTVEIKDNGKGLSNSAPSDKKDIGMGMRIMRFRAKMINAELEVKGGHKPGTTVKLHLHNKHIIQRETENVEQKH